ncbi:hypothetical protein [Microbulbifer sp. JMSA003]|uniref:hypothetical protein n=1 Tax=unclassified Microbulbifer TaxID=2619833 RepID=UPI0040394CBB
MPGTVNSASSKQSVGKASQLEDAGLNRDNLRSKKLFSFKTLRAGVSKLFSSMAKMKKTVLSMPKFMRPKFVGASNGGKPNEGLEEFRENMLKDPIDPNKRSVFLSKTFGGRKSLFLSAKYNDQKLLPEKPDTKTDTLGLAAKVDSRTAPPPPQKTPAAPVLSPIVASADFPSDPDLRQLFRYGLGPEVTPASADTSKGVDVGDAPDSVTDFDAQTLVTEEFTSDWWDDVRDKSEAASEGYVRGRGREVPKGYAAEVTKNAIKDIEKEIFG